MKDKSVIIIGGGLGGLFCGAILCKEGLKVTVIEKNATVGGGLQSFRRFGEVFDTGMHIVGGLSEHGSTRRICKYLGIDNEINVKEVDSQCCDEIYFGNDRQKYVLANTREGFIASLAKSFPDEESGIRNYVDAIFSIADRVAMFNLRPFDGFVSGYTPEMVSSADSFIAKFVRDERLRSVLAYMNPLYGGRGGQTPAYIHALIHALYINGTTRFVSGSYRFAETLADFIRANGGEVIVNDGVKRVEVTDRNVTSLTTCSGRRLSADYYISAIHPCTLLDITDEKAFPKSYRNRLNEIPNSYSAFSIYIKFRPKSFPYINHSVYYMDDYRKIWSFGDENSQWPLGFLFMTPPTEDGGLWARTALLTVPMTFSHVEKWADTTVGRRGEDYLRWKQQCADKVISKLERIYPDIRQSIEAVNIASPLTIRDYYGVKEGGISGYSKDCENMALSQVPVVTKVRNLFLTGQNNNLHGFCGVPLTAINTAEAILGTNHVINRINSKV